MNDGLRRFCTRFYVGSGQKIIMGTRVGYNSNTRWDLRGNSRLATIHAADKESRDKGGGVGDVVAVSVVRAWTRDNRYTLPQNGESNAMRHKAGRQRQGKSQRIVCFLMTFYDVAVPRLPLRQVRSTEGEKRRCVISLDISPITQRTLYRTDWPRRSKTDQ